MVSIRTFPFYKRRSFRGLFLIGVIGLWLASSLVIPAPVAANPASLVLTPVPIATGNTPFMASAVDLTQEKYVEEEFLVDGTANIYEYDANKQVQIKTPNVPYQTRLLVRRPTNPNKFNGTVIFEFMNPTAGFDIDFIWHYTSQLLMEEGYIWVGITGRPVALNFLKTWNAARYGSLNMVDAGLIYDAYSCVAVLLRDQSSAQNPLANYNVRRVIGTGHSQSSRYLVTYINEFHDTALLPNGASAFDGYFVLGAPAFARQINSMSPDATDERRFINAPVPVIRMQSETELALGSASARVADSPLYRTYEFSGTSHGDEEVLGLSQVAIERDIPGAPPALCSNIINPLSLSPFVRAGIINLTRWVKRGAEPPNSILINLDGSGSIIRDEHGNATARLRPPGIEVPLGSHFPQNEGGGPCILVGSFTPFDAAKLDELYPRHGKYVNQVAQAVNVLKAGGYILEEDAKKYKKDAAHSEIGK